MGDDTFNFPEHGFTCFHCGETFHSVKTAREHFGTEISDQPGCIMKLEARDRELLWLIREKDAELWRYRQEDQPIMRELYALGAAHARDLIEAEQRGYDKGLADGRSRLSADAAAAIECDLREGMTLRATATKHGTSFGKVRGIHNAIRRGTTPTGERHD